MSAREELDAGRVRGAELFSKGNRVPGTACSWPKHVAPVLGVVALCLIGPTLAACSATESGAADRTQTLPRWEDKATPATVGRLMNIELPAKATDARAAVQSGLQDDGLLLVFTLPASGVDDFVEQLGPERELRRRDEPRASVAKPMIPSPTWDSPNRNPCRTCGKDRSVAPVTAT